VSRSPLGLGQTLHPSPSVVGLSVHGVAQRRGIDDWNAYFDLVARDRVDVAPKSMNEEQKALALRAPFVAIDVDALGDGLVVIPRESEGTAAELPADIAAVLPAMVPSTPVRLRIEQVSAVEHAIAAGVPGLDPSGAARLSAGLGRPLILTTLEPNEAMRILARGRRRSVVAAAFLLVGGLAALAAGLVAAVLGS